MSSKLRLLLDESVPNPMAEGFRAVARSLNIEYVRDLPIAGATDPVVIDYAKAKNRIIVTTDVGINERRYAVCTHPGIIVIVSGKHRHESFFIGVFKRFIRSGRRIEARDAVTYLSEDSVRIKHHTGETQFKLD